MKLKVTVVFDIKVPAGTNPNDIYVEIGSLQFLDGNDNVVADGADEWNTLSVVAQERRGGRQRRPG